MMLNRRHIRHIRHASTSTFAWCMAITITVALVAPSLCIGQSRENHWTTAAARHGQVVMAPVGERTITIDGKLDDWGDLTRTSDLHDRPFLLHQRLNHLVGPLEDSSHDAALVKLRYDEEALYVAVRVADESVMNPFEGIQIYNGDCVELFVDVRPTQSDANDEPTVGTPAYSNGVHQLLIAAPTDDHPEVRTHHVDRDVGRIGPFDVAGKQIEGGWQIELRLPLASLKQEIESGRLNRPIGFEMVIDDVDEGEVDMHGPQQRGYSLSRTRGFTEDASLLGVALPVNTADAQSARQLHSPFLLDEPYLYLSPTVLGTYDGEKGVLVGAAARREAAPESAPLKIKGHFGATAFDQPEADEIQRPSLDAGQIQWRRDYPALGVTVVGALLPIEDWPSGRYRFKTDFAAADGIATELRTYGDRPVVPSEVVGVGREDVMSALTSAAVYLRLTDHFPQPGQSASGRVFIGLRPPMVYALSAFVADLPEDQKLHLRFELSPSTPSQSLWKTDLPLQYGWTEFTIPAEALQKEASYQLSLKVVDEHGRANAIRREERWQEHVVVVEPEAPLRVMPARDRRIEATAKDADPLLTALEPIGNPGRQQYPRNNPRGGQARSVHDLQAYQGKIYVGTGDWNANRGPVHVWAFTPQADVGESVRFEKQFTVDDESIDRFRVIGDRLYVPGIDAKESWKLGNIYYKGENSWQKQRTVPNGIHVFDVARFNGRLYVTTGTEAGAAFFVSDDDGESWQRVPGPGAGDFRFYEMMPWNDRLIVTSHQAVGAYQLQDQTLQRLLVPFWPKQEQQNETAPPVSRRVERLTRFEDALLYTGDVTETRRPLMVLRDLEVGGESVELFSDKAVRDIVVTDGRVYVLTGDNSDDGSEEGYVGQVYVSDDLRHWQRLARFTTPALPKSLAVMEGQLFVGLGLLPRWRQQPTDAAVQAAGTIHRLTSDAQSGAQTGE